MKKIVSQLMVYLLLIISIPSNVFADVSNTLSKITYKEEYYAKTVIQYKDKTLVNGLDNNWYEKTFIINGEGKKTFLKGLDYNYQVGNLVKTTYETPIELAQYDGEGYIYNLDTGKESKLTPNKEAYNKIVGDLKKIYSKELGYDLSEYSVLSEKSNEEKKTIRNNVTETIEIYLDDYQFEGDFLKYWISIYNEYGNQVGIYEGLYDTKGKIYPIEDGEILSGCETENVLYILGYSEKMGKNVIYAIDKINNSVKCIYETTNSINGIYIENADDTYLIYEEREEKEDRLITTVLKKSSNNTFSKIISLDASDVLFYKIYISEDKNIWVLGNKENSNSILYKVINNQLKEQYVFDEEIVDISIYNENIAAIGSLSKEKRWYGNNVINNELSNKNGWVKINNKWYYYKNGKAHIGWINLANKWYYLKSDGVMATGWTKIDGKWYYLNSGGDMATGWKKVDGKWYYLYSNGAMATNTVIDGWKIASNGVGTKIR